VQVSILEDAGPTAKIALAGRLDINGAKAVEPPLVTLAGSKHSIVIDMAAVTFMASPGIRLLVLASKALMERGGRLVLLNPIEPIIDLLSVTAVDNLVDIVRDDGAARAGA
jgi:anti-anti-sigma factor